MTSKQFSLDTVGQITVYKRRGVRRINLRINGATVKVTQPAWLPYATGVNFAKSQIPWILEQRSKNSEYVLKNGQLIGKQHTLYFKPASRLTSRVSQAQITVFYPSGSEISSFSVQQAARKAVNRALVQQAKALLPERVAIIARTYGFRYKSVRIRSMQSRWGSCTSNGDISLNCYLMMLSWDLIDYVLVHELTHTKHLHHGSDFWQAVSDILPDTAARRKKLRQQQKLILPLQHI